MRIFFNIALAAAAVSMSVAASARPPQLQSQPSQPQQQQPQTLQQQQTRQQPQTLQQQPQQPLYIVNGTAVADLRDVPPEDIVTTEMLPADEESVARYGEQANYGVIIVSLRYDTPARFEGGGEAGGGEAGGGDSGGSFADYIARHVVWGELERVARYVVRFTVREDGSVAVGKELESTDARLRRKVLRAMSKAPRWRPAMKDGRPVESGHVLRIQLPEGREMPRERAVILL